MPPRWRPRASSPGPWFPRRSAPQKQEAGDAKFPQGDQSRGMEGLERRGRRPTAYTILLTETGKRAGPLLLLCQRGRCQLPRHIPSPATAWHDRRAITGELQRLPNGGGEKSGWVEGRRKRRSKIGLRCLGTTLAQASPAGGVAERLLRGKRPKFKSRDTASQPLVP